MKRDDKRPDRRLLRRDAGTRPTREEENVRAPESEVVRTEGEGLVLLLETKDVSVVLPYHYEYAIALVPGPDGLQ